MTLKALHDKAVIADSLCQQDPYLHVYAIGDLDDFYWPYTQWYGWYDDNTLRAIALLYMAPSSPTVLLLHNESEPLAAMTRALLPYLPAACYIHASEGAQECLTQHYQLTEVHHHLKLGLTDRVALARASTTDASPLTTSDLSAIEALYKVSYPGNWFDPRMLETGCYMGIWEGDMLLSIAGIHVYSPAYQVAALGNITTHPDARGKGLARRVTAALCQHLLTTTPTISLNVKSDNHAALQLYQQLGFTEIAPYWECEASTRP